MKNWREATLGEFIRIKHGYAFKSAHYAKVGDHILLTPGNFKEDGGLKLQGEKEKYYSAEFPAEFLLKSGDLLLVMTDLTQEARILGSPAFIPENNRFLHNQRLGKVVDLKPGAIDRRYLFHLMNWADVRGQLRATATGTTVRHTAPERICAVRFPYPPLQYQLRIANILSAYDDLIENNTRRIAILEEMARRIYEEWFVQFRAPGCEGVPLVDSAVGSIPQDWKVNTLNSIASVNPEQIKMKLPPKRIGYIDIASVSPGRIDQITTMDFDDAPGRARRIVRDGDTIWSCVRPNRRSFAFIQNPGEDWVASTGFAVLRPKADFASYVYSVVTTDSFVAYLTGRATGAAYPAVTAETFEHAPIVVPPREIVSAFDRQVAPALRLANTLHRQNGNLRAQRDVLLPKLISGEIDVSEAESVVMEAAE